MNKLSLTSKAKLKLEQRHSSCKHGKERDRIKAILLYSQDWSVSMISQALRISESSV